MLLIFIRIFIIGSDGIAMITTFSVAIWPLLNQEMFQLCRIRSTQFKRFLNKKYSIITRICWDQTSMQSSLHLLVHRLMHMWTLRIYVDQLAQTVPGSNQGWMAFSTGLHADECPGLQWVWKGCVCNPGPKENLVKKTSMVKNYQDVALGS